MSPTLPTLTLYSRLECHLCETMQQQLAEFQRQHNFSLNLVDVDADSYLQMRYGDRVPVLAAGEQELCHYQFNAESVLAYFRNC